jgi:hypothetical protein
MGLAILLGVPSSNLFSQRGEFGDIMEYRTSTPRDYDKVSVPAYSTP